jgi:hypothetical protein
VSVSRSCPILERVPSPIVFADTKVGPPTYADSSILVENPATLYDFPKGG